MSYTKLPKKDQDQFIQNLSKQVEDAKKNPDKYRKGFIEKAENFIKSYNKSPGNLVMLKK